MKNRLMHNVPSKELNEAVSLDLRHKTGQTPRDYLLNFLRISRQYGFATQDDSWGELEKELNIAFGNLERLNRFMDFCVYTKKTEGDDRENSEIRDALIESGEDFWQRVQEAKKLVAEFAT